MYCIKNKKDKGDEINIITYECKKYLENLNIIYLNIFKKFFKTRCVIEAPVIREGKDEIIKNKEKQIKQNVRRIKKLGFKPIINDTGDIKFIVHKDILISVLVYCMLDQFPDSSFYFTKYFVRYKRDNKEFISPEYPSFIARNIIKREKDYYLCNHINDITKIQYSDFMDVAFDIGCEYYYGAKFILPNHISSMFVKEIIKIAREDNLNVNRCVIRYFKEDKEIKRTTIKISKKDLSK